MQAPRPAPTELQKRREEFDAAIKTACIAYINAIPTALDMNDRYVEAFGQLIKAAGECRKVFVSLHQTTGR